MRHQVLLATLMLLLPSAVSADTGRLSLKEAVTLALKNDHALKAAGHEKTATTEAVAVSRSRYLPRLSLEAAAGATNSPTRVFMMKLDEGRFAFGGELNHPKAAGDFRTSLTLEQPLLDLSVGRGVAMARAEESARGYALERQREEVAFRVYTNYLEVQRAKSHLRTVEQAVTDAREHGRLATVRNDAGVGLKSDELRTRTFLSERELDRIRAENALRLAQLRLALAVGSGAGSTVDILEELQPTPITLGNEDLIRLALNNRKELQEGGAFIDRAESGIKLARSAFLPTIYGTASYQMNDRDVPFGRDNDAWAVGAILRWELFDGLRRRHLEEKARAEKGAASEYLEKGREEIALEVEECYLNRTEAGKRLEVVRHGLLDAEEVVRLVKQRYENSLATMVDLLDAQTALDRSRAALFDAESAAALATARLYHAAGIFLQEVMK